VKRTIAWLLCLMTVLLAGCGGDPEVYIPTGNGLTWEDDSQGTQPEETAPKEQEIVTVYYPEVTLNPYSCTDFTNRALFSLMYQSLFTVDSNYQVSPVLCSRYVVSENMKIYSFYIEDATFSDGTRLTIEDVYASIRRAMQTSVYRGRFQHVMEVRLNDYGGITFYLDTAYENFPILLDVPIVKAAEVESTRPLGTGPYVLEENASGARLVRRKDWWCQPEMVLNASVIELRVAQDPTQIRDAFEFEDVGLVCANPGTETYADYRCDYELADCENGIFLYLGCNMQSKYFSNPQIRAALTYAIDRDAIVEKYYSSFAYSATLPASPLSPYYNHALAEQYAYDPERFVKALSDNYLSGTTIRILVNKGDTLRIRIAREIGTMMEACGLMAEVIEAEELDYYIKLAQLEYDIYVGQTRLSPNMDLSAFFMPNGRIHHGGMTNESIYAMCREALANKGNYLNLHKMVADDGRLCPVAFQVYSIHMTRGLINGLAPSRDNVFYYDLGKDMDEIRDYN